MNDGGKAWMEDEGEALMEDGGEAWRTRLVHDQLCTSFEGGSGHLYSKWLPTILESFPNLKSLSWECDDRFKEPHFEGMNQVNFSYVPECLHSSLELVDFKVPFSGLAGEMKVVRYFLENSALLKKLTLRLRYRSSPKDKFVKKLLRIPKGSTECRVVIFLIVKKSRKN
ncbi:unnamed protein product [Thlaspi arvense]|uniref:FBD domain-containing protein n=1 Tax=Thlaspi arvense TaxID=13288 RepID=A0AAU9SSW9_THLAR|nr:unnamed protein product [Thlaspi arvense]